MQRRSAGSSALLALAVAAAGPLAAGDNLVLDNPYVHVTRNAAPCAAARPEECGDRVLVALGPVELTVLGKTKKLSRGEVAVFRKGESYRAPASGEFLEVAWKPNHPPVELPPVQIAPEKNTLVFDGDEFFVFEEKLAPGETRSRHSHAQRLVVVLNDTRLQQWPDGGPELLRPQLPDDVHFNAPVVHVVKNLGARPLRNIVLELKGARPGSR